MSARATFQQRYHTVRVIRHTGRLDTGQGVSALPKTIKKRAVRNVVDASITWDYLQAMFQQSCESKLMETGAAFYVNRLAQFTKWVKAEGIEPGTFKGHDLTRYIDMRQALGRARATLAHDGKTACKFFKFCVKAGYLSRNPTADYEVISVPRVVVKVPNKSQLENLLRAVGDAWTPSVEPECRFFNQAHRTFYSRCHSAIVAGLIATGGRIRAVLNIKLDDYDAAKMKVQLDRKGGGKYEARFTDTWKRYVDEWLKVRPKFENDEGYMFIGKYGARIEYRTFQRSYSRYCQRAGLEGYKLHGVRHHAITAMGEVDILMAKQQADHKSITTTMRYTHPSEEHFAEQYQIADPLKKVVTNTRSIANKKRESVV